MKKTFELEFYSSPKVKIVDIKARQVLCQSPVSGIKSMNIADEQSDSDNWQQ